VELLVVISIIALLSTLAVVALNAARQKSRDSKRVAEMKQLQTAIELFNDKNPALGYKPSGCAAIDTAVSACTGTGAAGLADFMINIGGLNDPLGTALCTSSSSAVCNYAFTTAASVTNYTVTFYLEGTTAGLAAGLHILTPSGIQ